ncbi:MAG: peptidylprolyl isomerase [Nitrospirales bacterium]
MIRKLFRNFIHRIIRTVFATGTTTFASHATDKLDCTVLTIHQPTCPAINELVARKTTAVFGTTFAETLLLLTPGSWEGPIESGLGWHIVWVESIRPGRTPAFEEIEQDIKAQWTEEQRIESSRRTFDAMKARYEVVLPHAPAINDMMADTTETKGVP